MAYYFAYGSNLHLAQIRERLEDYVIAPLFVACLPNHKMNFPINSLSERWGGGVASFERAEGENLWGAVFEISDEQVKIMDGYETGYAHAKVFVSKENGEKISALTYVASKKGSFLPSNRYMKAIIGGARECELPQAYIEKLKKIRTNGVE
jgi:gamma-glutamylcyclotransferase